MFHAPEEGDRFPQSLCYMGLPGMLEPHRMYVKFSRLLSGRVSQLPGLISAVQVRHGDFEDMTFPGEARAEQYLAMCLSAPTDPRRIGLLGLSMGGAVASVVAGRNPHDVKALVLWSAADIEIMKAIFQAKKADGAAFCDERGFYDIGGLWLNPGFYDDLTRWDTYDEIAKFQGRALIVHGREDETVPVATAHRYYEVLGERAESVIIEGADHTYNRHDWEKTLFEETSRFLVAEL